MRQPSQFAHTRMSTARGRTLVVGLMAAFIFAMLAAAGSARAASPLKEEFAPFADCPVETAAVCLVANTTSGEFVINHKTVPINKTITLQGGLPSTSFLAQPLIGTADGNTLSKTPLTVPGGLVGIGGLGGEVTATAELAGPPSSVIVTKVNILYPKNGNAVTLPLKVKLSNEVLGNECYIGSDAEPIVLRLGTGTTSPPPPNTPIQGSATLESRARGKITFVPSTLVDNSFSVPGASGCGGALSPIIDAVVNLDVGIPSPAGYNTAIMSGTLEETSAELAKRFKPKPKKK